MEVSLTLGSSLQYLKGVGPERYKTLCRLDLFTLRDAFYFFPRRYEDRSTFTSVSDLAAGEKTCVRGVIQSRGLIRTRHRQTMFRVVISDPKVGARHAVPLLRAEALAAEV